MCCGICLLAVVLVAFALRERKTGIRPFIAAMGLACLWPLTPALAAPMDSDIVTPRDVLASYGGVYDAPALLNAMLADVAGLLGTASGRPDLHPRVAILDSPAVNAFAFRDGQFYVTRGLLALANDRAEAASAIALVMARLPENTHRPNAAALARSRIILETASPSQVMATDTVGVGIAARAGFDRYGAWRLLTSMKRSTELWRSIRGGTQLRKSIRYGSKWLAPASSGSVTSDRVRNALASARTSGADSDGRDRGAYLHDIDGMTYGDNADEGYVRGLRFTHPVLGITFVAPEGFVLDNTTAAVLGTKEAAGQALRLDVVQLPANLSLAEYLRSGWIKNIDEGSVEDFSVNDIPAATAIASPVAAEPLETWHFRVAVLRLGGEVYRLEFVAHDLTEDVDSSFRQSIQTFRRLSESERTMQPLRLKMIEVEPGDTVEALAARTTFTDHRLERFRVVNGLEPGAELKPGDLIKIVVEKDPS